MSLDPSHIIKPRKFSTSAAGLLFLLSACSSQPTRAPVPARAADHALQMLGKPYRFGGETPRGFDCSGLVYYSFGKTGVELPRDTQGQRRVGRRVQKSALRKGDLVFFDQEGKNASHVGIYLGDGSFVHAPSSGQQVRRDRLDAPYWQRHFDSARRP